jgi:hypothetical protein
MPDNVSSILVAKGITKAYGNLPVLKGVDLAVKRVKSSASWVLLVQGKAPSCISWVPWMMRIRARSTWKTNAWIN